MKFKKIQVIIDAQGEQVSPAVDTVITAIMRSIQGYSNLEDAVALGLAGQMSKFFHSQSFGEMVEDSEQILENPVIDEMNEAHSKKEDDYADEPSR